jgi:hypothetical protein
MKKIINSLCISFCFLLIAPSVFGQQCHDYACVITKVEKFMKQSPKDYKAILDNLDSAEGYPDSKPDQLRALRRRMFVLIENEKDEAKKARDQVKLEKAKSDSLLVFIKNENDRLTDITAKATKSLTTLQGIYDSLKLNSQVDIETIKLLEKLDILRNEKVDILKSVKQTAKENVDKRLNIKKD